MDGTGHASAREMAREIPETGEVVVIDTLLVIGELLNGASVVPAIVAVLLFRLITFWLIIVPGLLAHQALTRQQEQQKA